MKLVRLNYRGTARFGRLAGNQIELINGDVFGEFELSGVSMSAEKVQLLPPVRPSKIVAVGLNYRDHAVELGMDMPAEPILFLKPPSAVIGHQGEIVCPAASKQVEYEAELAVVIGKIAGRLPVEIVSNHILGFTCANDVTARDLQKRDGQWTRAKGFDTFCPLGPHIETELDTGDIAITLRKNDEVKQTSSTARMLKNVYELVSFISGVMTLYPGDVILTGTPPGVGPIIAGDLVEVEIEGIGRLSNSVV